MNMFCDGHVCNSLHMTVKGAPPQLSRPPNIYLQITLTPSSTETEGYRVISPIKPKNSPK